ncbi:unnamed protein product [Dovyalis caffra]|uniref:Uncharacterized protein n=1 Tax=Dovyalis caffra TaxID=77055 RepID=A0AAV1QYQ0_9ROSI|nr:unnamed protein product [Dovyalis caffra]
MTISFFNSLTYYFLIIGILHQAGSLNPVSAVCELSLVDGNKLYSFNLVSPLPNFPHGVLSEDGFAGAESDFIQGGNKESTGIPDVVKKGVPITIYSLWSFWVRVIAVVDLPLSFSFLIVWSSSALDCGGSSRCGMECSALVAKNIEGLLDIIVSCVIQVVMMYASLLEKSQALPLTLLPGCAFCDAVAYESDSSISSLPVGVIFASANAFPIIINVADNRTPHKGVVVKMTSSGPKHNCSLSVSVICDSNRAHGPHSLEKLGTCDYAAMLQHPSGCATINVHGKGLGWFGTMMIIILCLFGGYILIGAVYRHFFLGVRGLDVSFIS